MSVYLFEAMMISDGGNVLTRTFGVMAKTDHQAYVKAMRSALRRYKSSWYGTPKSVDLRRKGTFQMEDLK